MKRIVCFFDGTWNSADNQDELTNVVRLCRAVPEVARDGVRQIAHYIVGIATESSFGDFKFAAGAIGYGIADRIKKGYALIAEAYEPGDEIYAFGFSRGAYEARSLAGIIALVGVLKPENAGRIDEAWEGYRTHGGRPDSPEVARLRELAHWPARLKLIGVWDTVGNLGIPFGPRTRIGQAFAFHSTTLSPHVEVGLHALAIDEPRGTHSPTLWTAGAGSAMPAGQIVEQVWFPGSHADVGGGWKDTALSDISLQWMAERACATTPLDLDLVALRRNSRADPLGEQVLPTWDTLFRVANWIPYVRLIHQDRRGISPWRRSVIGTWRTNALPPGEIGVNESIHASAVERFGKRGPVRYGETVKRRVYRPRPLARALRKRR
jgi:uncharacterized protein (DUF2235 family)